MNGNELKLEDFIKQYKEDELEDKTVELIDLASDKITELTEEEFKIFMETE